MRLNHNMASLNVYKNYKDALVQNSSALNKISTGLKINSAKDNPNKIGLSEGLKMQIKSLQMAEKNIQDGVSMLQTFDGGLSSVNESLNRIKELTVQAGGVNTDEDLSIIQEEINQLKEHIDYTVNNTEFNGVKLLNSDKVVNNNYPKYLEHAVGANSNENISIPIFNIQTNMLKDDKGNYLSNLDVTDKNKMDENLSSIDGAIEMVNSVRSKYGAIQNRMETSMDNLGGSSMNLEEAEGRITDSDIALEMVEYSRTSILSETSIALMQQTNNFPQDVLRVLENMK